MKCFLRISSMLVSAGLVAVITALLFSAVPEASAQSIGAQSRSQLRLGASVTGVAKVKMSISSPSFKNNGIVPNNHSCWIGGDEDPGAGQSPALVWKNVPSKAARLALLVHDKDADFIHWFVIIEKKSSLFKKGMPAAVEAQRSIKNITQSENDFGIQGYSGPCPPYSARHKYTFELIALSNGVKGTYFGDDASSIKAALRKKTIAIATLTGFFQVSGAAPTTTPRATETPTPTPTPTPLPPLNAVQVTAGDAHTCAVLSTGGAKCWGYNGWGQLGDSTTTDRVTPVNVSGLTSGVTQISAGALHTCAVISSGGVKCWGSNEYGQLGDGTSTARLAAVDVVGLTSGVSQVFAGRTHTCALLTAGGVKCWGKNDSGQIGDNTTTNRLTPVDVSGLSTDVTQVTVGVTHTCAKLGAGGIKCWGSNLSGAIGAGSFQGTFLVPTDVQGLSSGVSQIAAGSHTCAVLNSGAVKCWGRNVSGGVGDSTTTDRYAPVDVTGLSSGGAQVATGPFHSCGLLTNGSLTCWGWNTAGQLGDNSSTDRLSPVSVSGLTAGVTRVVGGSAHTCALLNSGGVRCWGRNLDGQLGDGTKTNSFTPVEVRG